MSGPAAALDPTAPDPPAPHPRRRDIQGLRAVAVLLVVAFHAGLPLPGGFAGVDIFFVVSGFVITGLLVRELEATDRLDFRSFYSRRVRRLVPALSLLIVAVVIGSALLLNPLGTQQGVAQTGVAAPLLSANMQLERASHDYFQQDQAGSNPLLHTWSLSVEEQFYLLFPALVLVGWRLGRRRSARWTPRLTTGVLLGAGAVGSWLLSLVLTRIHYKLAFFLAPTRAWEFAAGGLLMLASPLARRLPGAVARGAGLAGLAMVVGGAFWLSGSTPWPGTAALLPVGAAMLVLLAGMQATGGATALLAARPLVWLGDRSYGWYLWHWPLIVFAHLIWPASWVLVLAGAASLIPTWLSYRYLENPIRYRVRLRGRRLVAMACLWVAIPVAASGALWFGARALLSAPPVVPVAQQYFQPHADLVRGCASGDARAVLADPQCTWAAGSSKGDVLLVGDSNAAMLTEPVLGAANALGYDFTVATFYACPFVDLLPIGAGHASGQCVAFVHQMLDQIKLRRPRLVVIASYGTNYVQNPLFQFQSLSDGSVARDPGAKARLWEQGLTSVLDDLGRAGVPTMVVHSTPHFGTWDLALCPSVQLLTRPSGCGQSRTRAQVDAENRLSLRAEQLAIRGVAEAGGLDLAGALCPGAVCRTNRGDTWIFRDGAHLSVLGARTLTQTFTQAIQGRLP